jgi:predicted AlkP superfamily phosphohydrolase/phosphomutase
MSASEASPSAGDRFSGALRGLAAGAAIGCLAGVIISAYNPFFVDSLWLGILGLWAGPAVLGAIVWSAASGLRGLIRGKAAGAGREMKAGAGRRASLVLLLLALVVLGLYGAGRLRERRPAETYKGPHVLVIGIDGATWTIMDPLMKRGELPNLLALKEKGASGVLTSIEPTLSPAVWTTMATGKTRAKHGVMDFNYTQEDLRVPRIWELLEGEGKTVGMMSWLVTWPPAVRHGFMVPGWLARTPATKPPGVHFAQDVILGEGLARTPREYLAYIVDAPRVGVRMSSLFEAFKLVTHSKLRKPPEVDLVYRKEMLKARLFSDIFCWLLSRYRPDFAAEVFYGTDSLAHVYWKYMEAADSPGQTSWNVSDADARKYGDVIRRYYRLVDSLLPKILGLLPEDTTVCVVSDHGHGSSGDDWGYLVIKAGRLIETLGLGDKVSLASVGDWTFLSAAPGAGPDALPEAVGILSSLKVEGKDLPLLQVEVKESATLSVRITEGVEPTDHFSTADGRTFKVSDFADKTELSGTHRLGGVIILSGTGIKKGYRITKASILDVAPTLLYIMGSPVGADMDGSVLTDCFDADYVESHPVKTVASRDGEVELPRSTAGREMPEAVRKRLRELGYVK